MRVSIFRGFLPFPASRRVQCKTNELKSKRELLEGAGVLRFDSLSPAFRQALRALWTQATEDKPSYGQALRSAYCRDSQYFSRGPHTTTFPMQLLLGAATYPSYVD